MERNFCLLIACSFSLLANENFWFSYRGVNENQQIVYEEKFISPHMDYTKKLQPEFLCQIDIKKEKYQSTYNYLSENFDKLFECFYPMSTRVNNIGYIETKGILERVEITILPTQFTVDFKDEFANISVLR